MTKTIYDQVKKLLEEDPKLQSSDKKLISKIWKDEMKAIRCPMDLFFTMFETNHLSSYESVTRARRKVQEKNPNLRGTTHTQRHKKAKKISKSVHTMHL